LFQYAAGRSLSIKYDSSLLLDISSFDTYTLHKFGLTPFQLKADVIGYKTLVELLDVEKKCFAFKKRMITPVNESQFSYNLEFSSFHNNSYLKGYWQSEKYFLNIRQLLIEEISISSNSMLSDADRTILEKIKMTNSCSIHLRRGDYISNKSTNEVHGVCSLNYYYDAILKLSELTKIDHFFIFSDDPDWVSKNLELEVPFTLVRHNGPERNYADFELMKSCNHQIIANSTFSWWAAWLNNDMNKIVVAPKRWFLSNEFDTKDLIPDNWLKI